MRTAIPYGDRKDAIRRAIVEVAKRGETIFYRDLGGQLGIPPQGPWKPVLDEIGREESAAGRPDLTYLVVNSGTGLPSQIGFEAAKPASEAQRELAEKTMRDVWNFYKGS